MRAIRETLTRQLLVINKLKHAGCALRIDAILEFLETESKIRDFKYPEAKDSQRRQLQRDVKEIESTFKIVISKVGQSSYFISEEENGNTIDYERLFADFDMLSALAPDSDVNRYILPERNRHSGSEMLPEIYRAIKSSEKIEFDYQNYRRGNSIHHHIISPHYLKEDQHRWYVISKDGDQIRIFALDRIKNLEISGETFSYDKSFDADSLFCDSFGIWADPSMQTEDIELRYDPLDGNFIQSVPLHPSQKIIVDNDEEFRISLRVKITNDFVMAILSRSRSVEVIRPITLRKRIADIYADALRRNS